VTDGQTHDVGIVIAYNVVQYKRCEISQKHGAKVAANRYTVHSCQTHHKIKMFVNKLGYIMYTAHVKTKLAKKNSERLSSRLESILKLSLEI